eukprot:6873753-Pyramimonas_sp.AAC.1
MDAFGRPKCARISRVSKDARACSFSVSFSPPMPCSTLPRDSARASIRTHPINSDRAATYGTHPINSGCAPREK